MASINDELAKLTDAERLQKAIDIIGQNPKENASLHFGTPDTFLKNHVEPLRQHAPLSQPLIDRLELPSVMEAVAAYSRDNDAARSGQSKYKCAHNLKMFPIVFAGLLAMIFTIVRPRPVYDSFRQVFMVDESSREHLIQYWTTGLPVVWVIVGVLALWAIYAVRTPLGKLIEKRTLLPVCEYLLQTIIAAALLLLFLLLSYALVFVDAQEWVEGLRMAWFQDPFAFDQVDRIWQLWIPWAVFLLLLFTPLIDWLFRVGPHYTTWVSSRGTAEAERQNYFRHIFNLATSPNGEGAAVPATAEERKWLLLLTLEYFRRWQVEVQNAYHRDAVDKHGRNTNKARWTKFALAVAMTILAAVLLYSVGIGVCEQGGDGSLLSQFICHISSLPFIETIGGDVYLLILVLMLFAAGGFFAYETSLANSIRNRPRFDQMQSNFEELLGEQLSIARGAALAGDERAVRAYVDNVHSIMTAEHAEWVKLGKLDVGVNTETYKSSGAAGGNPPPVSSP